MLFIQLLREEDKRPLIAGYYGSKVERLTFIKIFFDFAMPFDSVAELVLASQTVGSGSSSNERGLELRVKERNGRFPGSVWSQEFSSSAQQRLCKRSKNVGGQIGRKVEEV